MDQNKARHETQVVITKLFREKRNYNILHLGTSIRDKGFYCLEKWIREKTDQCIIEFGYGKRYGDDVVFDDPDDVKASQDVDAELKNILGDEVNA